MYVPPLIYITRNMLDNTRIVSRRRCFDRFWQRNLPPVVYPVAGNDGFLHGEHVPDSSQELGKKYILYTLVTIVSAINNKSFTLFYCYIEGMILKYIYSSSFVFVALV